MKKKTRNSFDELKKWQLKKNQQKQIKGGQGSDASSGDPGSNIVIVDVLDG